MNELQPWASGDEIDRLRHGFDGVCWWCRRRPADSREHKYKASDLKALWNDGGLYWFGEGGPRHIGGKKAIGRDRHGVLTFSPSLCSACNNAHSQPLDRAYDKYSQFAASGGLSGRRSLDFPRLYGAGAATLRVDLARYFTKHFGCRMVADGFDVPDSMRSFLDGAPDMPDVHLGFAKLGMVAELADLGTFLHPTAGIGFLSADRSRLTGYVTGVFIRDVGVRFEWREGGFGSSWKSFFLFSRGVINYFETEEDMHSARRTSMPRACSWLNMWRRS